MYNRYVLDEANFRYNSTKANKNHEFVQSEEPLFYKQPTECTVCGRERNRAIHTGAALPMDKSVTNG